MVITPDAPQWAYQQAAAIIRARIEAGEITGRVPSQMALARDLGVSHVTIQRALRLLKDEGVVYGMRGLGTFVSERRA